MCPLWPAEDGAPLRETTHNEMTVEMLAPAGKRIVDVGCGEGALARHLAGEGADVVAIDPAESKIEKASAAAAAAGSSAAFRVGVGEALPFEDASLDVVIYSNSLHHVAIENIRTGLAEAARVLKPGGLLYVMEPVAKGGFFDVQSMWNDETEVRSRAYEEVEGSGDLGLEAAGEFFYGYARRARDFDHFVEIMSQCNPKNRDVIAELGDAVRRRFEEVAARDGDEFALDMTFRINMRRKTAKHDASSQWRV